MSVKVNVALTTLLTFGLLGTGCINSNAPQNNDISSVNLNEADLSGTENSSDNNSASVDISESIALTESLSSAEVTESETTDRGKSAENERLNSATDTVTEFMNGFLHHNYDVLVQYGGAQSLTAYDFLNGVYLTDWEIVDTVIYDETDTKKEDKIFTYKINLDIYESDCELFPVGESLWELDVVDSDNSYFSSFRPQNGQYGTVLADSIENLNCSDAVKMCYAFTSELGWLGGEAELLDLTKADKRVEKELMINNLIVFCRSFNNTQNARLNELSYNIAWIEESAEKLLGITDINFTDSPAYNEENGTVYLSVSKYCCGYGIISDEQYDEESKLHTVVIDWYADTIYLSKACSVKYVLTDNDDGTLKLLTAEKLYDSNERLVYFSNNIDIGIK